MEREDRVGRQSCGIDAGVGNSRVERGILDQPARAPHGDYCLLVGVCRRDRQRTRRLRSHRAAGCYHGEFYLVERRGDLREHGEELRRLALRRAEIYRNSYRFDSRAPRRLEPDVECCRAAHLAEQIARRTRVTADLFGQHAQQVQLELGGTHATGKLEPADEAAHILRVERARAPLQRDHVVKKMRFAASGRPANPEHGAVRVLEMLIENLPRAFGGAGEDVAGDGGDTRRGFEFEAFRCGRFELKPSARVRSPSAALLRVHRLRL